jgi:hypothetical protein
MSTMLFGNNSCFKQVHHSLSIAQMDTLNIALQPLMQKYQIHEDISPTQNKGSTRAETLIAKWQSF